MNRTVIVLKNVTGDYFEVLPQGSAVIIIDPMNALWTLVAKTQTKIKDKSVT